MAKATLALSYGLCTFIYTYKENVDLWKQF